MALYKTHQCPKFYPCILTLSDYLNILSSYSHHITLEMQTVSLAVRNISPEHIQKMENLLMKEEKGSGNDDLLNQTNISFHLEIYEALRSKNKKFALERMKHHLTWVRKSIEKWCPDENRQINE